MHNEALDEHQPDKRFAETDSVTQERAAVLTGNLDEGPICLLLVAVEHGKHSRLSFVPFPSSEFSASKQLIKRCCKDFKRRVFLRVANYQLQKVLSYLVSLLPVPLEPLLKLRDLSSALYLDIQFNVLS